MTTSSDSGLGRQCAESGPSCARAEPPGSQSGPSGRVPEPAGAGRPPAIPPMPPIVPAGPSDLPDVEALLAAVGLPLDGVAACVRDGSVVVCREHDGCLLGVAATERHGDAAILRSVAVHRPARGRGLGRALAERATADARKAGAREAWLLTETAEAFFAGLGWSRADRVAAPPAVAASVEFATACPTSAIAMRRTL